MKEATGQLNSTVVVILAIGVLSAFFYFTIWPNINTNLEQNTNCSKAWCEGKPNDDGVTVKCHYKSGDSWKDITCLWKEIPKK